MAWWLPLVMEAGKSASQTQGGGGGSTPAYSRGMEVGPKMPVAPPIETPAGAPPDKGTSFEMIPMLPPPGNLPVNPPPAQTMPTPSPAPGGRLPVALPNPDQQSIGGGSGFLY